MKALDLLDAQASLVQWWNSPIGQRWKISDGQLVAV